MSLSQYKNKSQQKVRSESRPHHYNKTNRLCLCEVKFYLKVKDFSYPGLHYKVMIDQ